MRLEFAAVIRKVKVFITATFNPAEPNVGLREPYVDEISAADEDDKYVHLTEADRVRFTEMAEDLRRRSNNLASSRFPDQDSLLYDDTDGD